MRYSEFHDILPQIAAMDADVISSQSRLLPEKAWLCREGVSLA